MLADDAARRAGVAGGDAVAGVVEQVDQVGAQFLRRCGQEVVHAGQVGQGLQHAAQLGHGRRHQQRAGPRRRRGMADGGQAREHVRHAVQLRQALAQAVLDEQGPRTRLQGARLDRAIRAFATALRGDHPRDRDPRQHQHHHHRGPAPGPRRSQHGTQVRVGVGGDVGWNRCVDRQGGSRVVGQAIALARATSSMSEARSSARASCTRPSSVGKSCGSRSMRAR